MQCTAQVTYQAFSMQSASRVYARLVSEMSVGNAEEWSKLADLWPLKTSNGPGLNKLHFNAAETRVSSTPYLTVAGRMLIPFLLQWSAASATLAFSC